MKKHAKRVLVLALATLSLVVGLAGLVLPLLQGWLFLAISLLLFSMYSPRLRGWVDAHTVRYPALHRAVHRVNVWIIKIFGAPEGE